MNARFIFSLAGAAALISVPAYAAKPPVKVEVIVDGDEDEDFFDEPQSATPADPDEAKTAVRENADDAFEQLEGKKPVRVRKGRKTSVEVPAGEAAGGNQQVVNVIVQGKEQQTGQRTPVTGPPSTQAPPVTGPPSTLQAPPAPDNCNCKVGRRHRRPRRRWWNVPNHIERGDVLFSVGGGWSTAGGLFGLQLEGMPTRGLGVHLKFHATGFDGESARDGGSNFLGETWGVGDIDDKLLQGGFAHLVDVGIGWHIFRGSRFDLHPTLSISHFGYSVDLRSLPEQRGGSAFVRFGLGLNYFWRRLFVGVDVGWYPIELVRYEVRQSPNDPEDDELRTRDIDDYFDERRIVGKAHVGIRF